MSGSTSPSASNASVTKKGDSWLERINVGVNRLRKEVGLTSGRDAPVAVPQRPSAATPVKSMAAPDAVQQAAAAASKWPPAPRNRRAEDEAAKAAAAATAQAEAKAARATRAEAEWPPVYRNRGAEKAAVDLDKKVAEILSLAESPSSLDDQLPVWADPFQKRPAGTLGEGVTEEWKALVDKILDVQLDAKFQQRFDETCDFASLALVNNKVVQNAYANWSKWISEGNQEAIEATIQEVLSVHSATLGDRHGTPHPTPNVSFAKQDKGGPEVFGSFNPATGVMEIGEIASDFTQLIDTLTHENTHAYQKKLVEEKQAGLITPGHDDYLAAAALEMNMGHGYIKSDASYFYDNGFPDKAYKTQCTEAHAMAAGKRIAAATELGLCASLPPKERRDRSGALARQQQAKLVELKNDIVQAKTLLKFADPHEEAGLSELLANKMTELSAAKEMESAIQELRRSALRGMAEEAKLAASRQA